MVSRVKKIGGCTAFARWLQEVEDTNLEIHHEKLPRTPYAYSMFKEVSKDAKGRLVVCLETKHNHYEVWQVTADECQMIEGQLKLA